MTELAVFILSYNRPQFIQEAIDSILQQTFKDFDLIISDNSSNDLVYSAIKKYQTVPNFQVIRQQPSLDSIPHFNQILQRAQKYPYFMMFHDDDLMLPDCLKNLMAVHKQNTEIAASSCNAFIKYDDDHHHGKPLFNSNLKKDLIIYKPKELINHYLSPRLSHPPFPFYIYNSKKIAGIKMNFSEGGKHSDMSFLCKVTEKGPLYWIAKPLAEYRRHQSNDSGKINLRDLFSLSHFVFNRYHDFYFKMSVFMIKSSVLYFKSLF